MATVYLRGKIWWARWCRPDGSRISRSTRLQKKREAARVAAQMEAADRAALPGIAEPQKQAFIRILERAADDARRGRLDAIRAEQHLADIRRVADPSFRVVSLEKWAAEWLERQRVHIADTTFTYYQKSLTRVLERLPRHICAAPVGELTADALEGTLHAMVGTIRGTTLNQSLRAFRSCLEEAVKAGLALRNVARGIRTVPETDSIERAPFSPAEVAALRAAATPEWSGLILVAAHTGLRMSDAVALGREHIEGTLLVIRPSKTARSRKTITIPLSPDLQAWLASAPDPFFPGLRFTSASTLSMQFAKLMETAGIAREVTLPGGITAARSFHSLRHSFVSWLAEADVQADVRQKLSGHATGAHHATYTHHDAALTRAIASLPPV